MRPDLFDFTNMNGGPRIVDVPAYMTAVVAALGEAGYCAGSTLRARSGSRRRTRSASSGSIASRVGWGVPTDHWVMRKYKGACAPSVF